MVMFSTTYSARTLYDTVKYFERAQNREQEDQSTAFDKKCVALQFADYTFKCRATERRACRATGWASVSPRLPSGHHCCWCCKASLLSRDFQLTSARLTPFMCPEEVSSSGAWATEPDKSYVSVLLPAEVRDCVKGLGCIKSVLNIRCQKERERERENYKSERGRTKIEER